MRCVTEGNPDAREIRRRVFFSFFFSFQYYPVGIYMIKLSVEEEDVAYEGGVGN